MTTAAHPARPVLIGVAGGSGSGKTTVAERLAGLVGDASLVHLRLDAYYRDNPHLPLEERADVDYDHPDAFDWELLIEHLDALVAGNAVEVPVYDFATHARRAGRTPLPPARAVVVEGILVLHHPELRARFDLRVFVDTDADVRFIRRLERDVTERGRSLRSVIDQYLATVRPGHELYIEPTRRHADVIIPDGGLNDAAMDVLAARLRELL
jgi:uridine kinase